MMTRLAIALLSFAVFQSAASAQTNYNGNGLTGFGGTMGNSQLSITDSAGVISFSYTTSGAIGNNSVFYIDSTAGGFVDTSQFSDSADGGRRATSGFNSNAPTGPSSRTLAIFANGFAADYAIVVGNGFAVLFQLAAGTDNSLMFLKNANFANPTGNQFTFSITETDIGLTSGQGFKFVGSLISDSAYRSNETYGTSVTVPGTPGDAPNSGFTGTTTFSNFQTFAPIPEPSSISFLVGPACFGAYLLRRRKS